MLKIFSLLALMASSSMYTHAEVLYDTPKIDTFYDACNVVQQLGLIESTVYRVEEHEAAIKKTCGRVNYTDRFGTERASIIASSDAGEDNQWTTITIAMNTNRHTYDKNAFVAFREAVYRIIAGQMTTNEQRKNIYNHLFKDSFFDDIKTDKFETSLPFYKKNHATLTHRLNKDNGYIFVLSLKRN